MLIMTYLAFRRKLNEVMGVVLGAHVFEMLPPAEQWRDYFKCFI